MVDRDESTEFWTSASATADAASLIRYLFFASARVCVYRRDFLDERIHAERVHRGAFEEFLKKIFQKPKFHKDGKR